MCYEAGVKIKTLQAWMGHADATMIMEIYAFINDEQSGNSLWLQQLLAETILSTIWYPHLVWGYLFGRNHYALRTEGPRFM